MENVNKQLLDAAKSLVSALNDAMPHMEIAHDGIGPDCTKQFQALIDGSQAIVAAEQAQQPAVTGRDAIRRIFMAHGFTIKEGNDDLKPYVYEAAEALLRELSPAVAVPDGYALVPIDPTREMLIAINWPGDPTGYRAMLAAAQKGSTS